MLPPTKWLKENHPELDPRVTAAGPELARSTLKDIVSSAAFTNGIHATINCPNVCLKAEPNMSAATTTELLFGEQITVLKSSDGWAWVQATLDDYVGYVPEGAFIPKSLSPTHHVSTPLTHLYGSPDMKLPALMPLPMGAMVQVMGNREKGFVEVSNPASPQGTTGWVFSEHLLPTSRHAHDVITVAEQFLNAPYLWGGRTMAGIDCSGLVQLTHRMTGVELPRDTDMQLAFLTQDIPDDAPLERGDLIFFPGHVAIMVDDKNIIHANGYAMKVMIEPLQNQIDRLKDKYGNPVTGRKRPSSK